MPTLPAVLGILQKGRIAHGIDVDAVNRALDVVHERINDVIWQIPIARGEPPIQGQPARVDYQVRVLNKSELRANPESLSAALSAYWEPVKEGTVIGRIVPAEAGVPGKNVFGDPVVPEEPPALGLKLGEDLKQTRGLLVAQCQGYPIVDEDQVYITPMYVIDHPLPGSVQDLSFSGAVLVRGDLRGPGTLECDELFLLGNCDLMDITSGGDVFMSGGVSGHHKSAINADGSFYASFINEAEVSALGEVVVANAIVGSRVVSNDSVRVTSPRGIIAGGTIQSLRGVIVQTLGSEFGMFTETIVGKDFLTSHRLSRIAETIRVHEENLRRIQELKQEMAKANMRVEELPPDKQEIYIGILRKESQSQSELRSLARRKIKLSHHLREFIAASVRVLDSVYPPLRVQIGDEIKEINDRLDAVTLQYDAGRVVITAAPPKENQESP
jgi:uncharacterized protein (DUF342 family)